MRNAIKLKGKYFFSKKSRRRAKKMKTKAIKDTFLVCFCAETCRKLKLCFCGNWMSLFFLCYLHVLIFPGSVVKKATKNVPSVVFLRVLLPEKVEKFFVKIHFFVFVFFLMSTKAAIQGQTRTNQNEHRTRKTGKKHVCWLEWTWQDDTAWWKLLFFAIFLFNGFSLVTKIKSSSFSQWNKILLHSYI